MTQGHKPTARQRKQALITGLVLAAMAVGIYAVIILKIATHG